MKKPEERVFVLALVPNSERARMEELLSEPKFDLRFVDSLPDAIRVHEAEGPAVLIHDEHHGQGWEEALASIRNLEAPPKIIISTLHGGPRLWSKVLNLGGHDVVPKPWDKDLVRVLTHAAS